ncbi:hypothetical protein [Paenibacillus sp. NPDC093718]|uniref:hypothetical protein n=1 Tax=Paenibacillus sp. NPDC093718 TaxID=3390601 RepID=UPI003CFF7128
MKRQQSAKTSAGEWTVIGACSRIQEVASENTVDRLFAIDWWNWTREQLDEGVDDLGDVETFIGKYESKL